MERLDGEGAGGVVFKGTATRSGTLSSRAAADPANVAQLVEQLTRNEQVTGSSPVIGSARKRPLMDFMGRFFRGVQVD